jgi:flagellar protein FliL
MNTATVGDGSGRLKLSLSRIIATLCCSGIIYIGNRMIMRSSIYYGLLHLVLLSALLSGGAHAAEHGGGEGGEEKAAPSMSEYLDIKPALITNYGGPGPIHFLKLEITLRLSKDPEANQLLLLHMPHIRHELIMLFSRQNEETLQSMPGKEQLRQEALAAVQKIMQSEENKKVVEDLLFTNFVIQR